MLFLQHLKNLQLADNKYHKHSPIDVLIGADLKPYIFKNNRIFGNKNGPVTIRTIFGWVLQGRSSIASAAFVSLSTSHTYFKWSRFRYLRVKVLGNREYSTLTIFVRLWTVCSLFSRYKRLFGFRAQVTCSLRINVINRMYITFRIITWSNWIALILILGWFSMLRLTVLSCTRTFLTCHYDFAYSYPYLCAMFAKFIEWS